MSRDTDIGALHEASEHVDDPRLVALGIVLSESLEPAPPDAAGIETRIVEWHQLAAYPDHPMGEEFARYYAWKLLHLPATRRGGATDSVPR